MSILPEQLESLSTLLVTLSKGENPVPVVREQFPGLAVSRCSEEDMRDENPFLRAGNHDVFLVDTSNHCWRIVDELAAASGVILATLN
ncbi:MAG: HCV capsid domain containing protein [Betaproteobacteria bacterium]|nr:HCV capsid domain containing protein [Betaproteobacteria bacterium]